MYWMLVNVQIQINRNKRCTITIVNRTYLWTGTVPHTYDRELKSQTSPGESLKNADKSKITAIVMVVTSWHRRRYLKKKKVVNKTPWIWHWTRTVIFDLTLIRYIVNYNAKKLKRMFEFDSLWRTTTMKCRWTTIQNKLAAN